MSGSASCSCQIRDHCKVLKVVAHVFFEVLELEQLLLLYKLATGVDVDVVQVPAI